MDASRRHPMLIAIALVANVVLGACTPAPIAPSFGSPAPSPSTSPSASPSSSPSASPTPVAEFPITLTDDEGAAVTISEEPQRIVSLQPAITETLFALGAGNRVVGKVEDITPYPPEADGLPVVATYLGVDVEKVVGLEPDLVIAGGNGGNPPDDIEQLRSLGIPVLVVYPATLDGVLDNIALIGDAVGQGADADELTADLKTRIEAIAGSAAGLSKPRTFYELGDTPELYSPADDSFIAQMISLAGATPITTGSPTAFSIPLEVLIQADPEVIILADAAGGVTAETVAARPGWAVMTAVKNGDIRPADDAIITRPGPRIADGFAELAKAIHPDIVLPAS